MIYARFRRKDAIDEVVHYAARDGAATCVAGNLPLDATLEEIGRKFQDLHDLRPELKSAKLIHLVVSFAEQDRPLTATELGEIARESMEALGLADGWWISWIHLEAHVLHLHTVASAIRFDSSRVETKNAYRQQVVLGRKLEIQHGLWRAPSVKGGPVLPPLVEVTPVEGPAFGVPVTTDGFTKQVKDAVHGALRARPGLTLPDLAERLRECGIRLAITYSGGGTRISGLGFGRIDGKQFEHAGKLGLSLLALQKLGLDYDAVRDIPRLAEAGSPPQGSPAMPFIPMPLAPLLPNLPRSKRHRTLPLPLLPGVPHAFRSTTQTLVLAVATRAWEALAAIPTCASGRPPVRLPIQSSGQPRHPRI
jgi:hypothetical protein